MKTFWVMFKTSGQLPASTTFFEAESLDDGLAALGLTLADVDQWRDTTARPPR